MYPSNKQTGRYDWGLLLQLLDRCLILSIDLCPTIPCFPNVLCIQWHYSNEPSTYSITHKINVASVWNSTRQLQWVTGGDVLGFNCTHVLVTEIYIVYCFGMALLLMILIHGCKAAITDMQRWWITSWRDPSHQLNAISFRAVWSPPIRWKACWWQNSNLLEEWETPHLGCDLPGHVCSILLCQGHRCLNFH